MKKLFCIVLGIAALMACTKETNFSSNNTDLISVSESGQKTYSVTAYFEEITKATISETDGKFSWSGDEQIAIWDNTHEEFVTFDIDTYSNESEKRARFTTTTAKDGASFVGNVAYYPASIATKTGSTPSYNFPTSFSSKDAAAKGFPMQGTVTGNEIKFSHLGCLINITMNNVPSFTTKLILNDETNNITVPVTPSAGVLNAVVPIPAGTYVLTAKLEDDNSNVFYTKARLSQAYSARSYYTINPISLGKLLTFTNEADWASPKVHLWKSDDDSKYTDFTTSGTPHKLYLHNSNVYYVLLDSDVESWTAEGSAIGVQFFSNESDKTQTGCVYLLRNIDFLIPAGGGMKTEYRIYPHGGSYSSPYARAYYDDTQTVSIKVDCSAISFGTPYLHIGFGANTTSWTSKADMTNDGENIYSYTFPASYFGSSGIVVVSNSKDADGWKSVDYTADFSSKKSYTIKLGDGGYGNPATITQTASTDFEHTELLGSAPGTAFTSPGSPSGAIGTYLSFSTDYYGKNAKVIFSDNGANAKPTWSIIIDRDYDYGL